MVILFSESVSFFSMTLASTLEVILVASPISDSFVISS
ncbi:hypothetical protein AWRI1631_20590 [Saccharomyces cerevisiae AWRI1631]|uniref:Uncharacterized protein n=1 Tax=Saccharomyces cerevisiae (strain AWRI1631) TaxID=545124 RepID=B5VDU2_YEAS6|nr:hypothetical protein AWRI1631_20590 [Saccharomyces cerevisiae AWRI1631]